MIAMIGAGTLMLAAPSYSAEVGEDVLDIHGWRIDPADSANPGQRALDIHGWRIEAATPQVLATIRSPYVGTSLRVEDDGLGFTDPRPGQSDYSYSPDGELGFDDPRPGR
jgi:hypothetical protein